MIIASDTFALEIVDSPRVKDDLFSIEFEEPEETKAEDKEEEDKEAKNFKEGSEEIDLEKF